MCANDPHCSTGLMPVDPEILSSSTLNPKLPTLSPQNRESEPAISIFRSRYRTPVVTLKETVKELEKAYRPLTL